MNLTKTEAINFLLHYQNINTGKKYISDSEIISFIKKRVLFDWWDKNMCILSLEDWPYFNRKRNACRHKYEKRNSEFKEVKSKIFKYLQKIEYISSSDIRINKKVNWSWAPANIVRAALESMYHSGELVIHHKKGPRKYYGLSCKLLPKRIMEKGDPNTNDKKFKEWFIKRRINSIGLLWNKSGDAWLGCPCKKGERELCIKNMLLSDQLEKISIQGIDDSFYTDKKNITQFKNTPLKSKTSFIECLNPKYISAIFKKT
ncbi:MAG: crosslink repair DNA glycosylase YcaQ family protein [Chitinispirillia bacterium]|jgi:hypothetical protein